MERVLTITQKIIKNQAKHWISRRSFIVPYNYKGKLIFSFGQSVPYCKTDKFSCFDNYIDFQCILFQQTLQTGLSTFFSLPGELGGILAFWPIYFGSIWWSRKGPSFGFVLGVFTPWKWTVVEYFVPLAKLHGIW